MSDDRGLLFGLLALRNGLIGQEVLLAAFETWNFDRSRSLADHLVARGSLSAGDRAALETQVARHLEPFGGDAESGPSTLPFGPSTRERIEAPRDPEQTASVARLGGGPYLEQARLGRALALARVGRHAEAIAEADALAETFLSSPDQAYNAAAHFAQAGAAAGRDESLSAGERQRLAGMHLDRAFSLLRDAAARRWIAMPFVLADLMSDPDLDPLRGRPAFRSLLDDVLFPDDPFAREH